MGSFLAERHKDDMVVVGFAFHEGRYTAVARGAGLQANDAGLSAYAIASPLGSTSATINKIIKGARDAR